ncbi:MAG: tRNA (N6-threonylcarbamoyladenosine(37)-N6)-methyltransferase TrmO [Butyrivibrio sp.]|nr:tRNA (N6-threonylcarbamoyladenosine(37)-N6)-methyltransferase TrmO [Butyrivibrio sp.]
MKKIATIRTDLPDKFGLPRQSGLVPELKGRIVFEAEYRNPDALRGIEGFSHLWIIWQFSRNKSERWSPTVRPPRLGGNARMGVFATRSPFRPNPLGLSCVRLEAVRVGGDGPELEVSGIDMADNTPIYDIKPYLPYTDSHPNAQSGFAAAYTDYSLEVLADEALMSVIPPDRRAALIGLLSNDPRPSYQHDDGRVYGLSFAGFNIKFTVSGSLLTVREITKAERKGR